VNGIITSIRRFNGAVYSKAKIASRPPNNIGKIGRIRAAEFSKNPNSFRIK
jgi:hypothetical protein